MCSVILFWFYLGLFAALGYIFISLALVGLIGKIPFSISFLFFVDEEAYLYLFIIRKAYFHFVLLFLIFLLLILYILFFRD